MKRFTANFPLVSLSPLPAALQVRVIRIFSLLFLEAVEGSLSYWVTESQRYVFRLPRVLPLNLWLLLSRMPSSVPAASGTLGHVVVLPADCTARLTKGTFFLCSQSRYFCCV